MGRKLTKKLWLLFEITSLIQLFFYKKHCAQDDFENVLRAVFYKILSLKLCFKKSKLVIKCGGHSVADFCIETLDILNIFKP